MKRSGQTLNAVVLLLFWCVGPLLAQEPIAQVRALLPGDTPWVGQKTVLIIELLAPGLFSSTPRFDFPETPGLLIVPQEGHPVVGSETISGQSYTVQRYEIALFAKREGAHEIAPFKIRFNIKRTPLDKDNIPQEVETPRLVFSAKLPPGAEKLTALISAQNLEVQEKWEPATEKGKVGDAFTRTIIFRAPNIPAMAFPSLSAIKIDGLGIYPKQPVVSDHDERGELTGERRDAVVYVCERSGHFVVPALQLTWWNLDAQKLETIHLSAHVFDIVPNPALPPIAIDKTKWFSLSHIPKVVLIMSFLGTVFLIVRLLNLWKLRHRFMEALSPVHLEPLNPTDQLIDVEWLKGTRAKD